MWTQIDASNVPGLARHVAIMQQMDRGYAELKASSLVFAISEEQGEVWHYQGTNFEIAMMFRYLAPRRQFHLAHVGFVGNVQPAQVLDINILRGRDFFRSHSIQAVVGVRPKSIDFQPLALYHDLCLTHPNLKISVESETEEKVVWNIAYKSLS